MSIIEKLIIPLISDCIKYKHIDTVDFIGVYTEDVNSPSDMYIYLVFLYRIENLRFPLCKEGVDRVRKIGKKLYQIIKYPITSDLKHLLNGEYSLISNEGISKIYNFWEDKDPIIANFPLSRTLAMEKYSRIIPEEDFTGYNIRNKKVGGITVTKQ